ncbi:MAG TPA: ATP-dependent helicase, partial [Nitrospiria bacterium]
LGDHARNTGTSLQDVLRRSQEVSDLPRGAHEGIASLMALLDRYGKERLLARPAALAQKLLEETGLREAIRAEESDPAAAERRNENLAELISGIQGYEASARPATLEGYLDKICLIGGNEELREEAGEGVRLMTIHSAKGLEFPFVMLPGLEEEFLPHKRSIESAATLQEERRLFYVAITRAQRQLLISYTRSRHRFNKSVPRQPSRFLSEIPDALLDREVPGVAAAVGPEEEARLGREFFSDIRRMFTPPGDP